jgi:hypothetical protein
MGEGHRSEGSSCKQASKQCKMGPRGKPQEWDLEVGFGCPPKFHSPSRDPVEVFLTSLGLSRALLELVLGIREYVEHRCPYHTQ